LHFRGVDIPLATMLSFRGVDCPLAAMLADADLGGVAAGLLSALARRREVAGSGPSHAAPPVMAAEGSMMSPESGASSGLTMAVAWVENFSSPQRGDNQPRKLPRPHLPESTFWTNFSEACW
jgi:hypothetical protein